MSLNKELIYAVNQFLEYATPRLSNSKGIRVLTFEFKIGKTKYTFVREQIIYLVIEPYQLRQYIISHLEDIREHLRIIDISDEDMTPIRRKMLEWL